MRVFTTALVTGSLVVAVFGGIAPAQEKKSDLVFASKLPPTADCRTRAAAGADAVAVNRRALTATTRQRWRGASSGFITSRPENRSVNCWRCVVQKAFTCVEYTVAGARRGRGSNDAARLDGAAALHHRVKAQRSRADAHQLARACEQHKIARELEQL